MNYCRRGHLIAGANLDPGALESGGRECRACHRAWKALGAGKFSEELFSAAADTEFLRTIGWLPPDAIDFSRPASVKWSRELTEREIARLTG